MAEMSLGKKMDITETCNRLEEVHAQLKAIQERNTEILEHLAAAQAIATEGGITLPSQMSENLSRAEEFSKKINNVVENQCDTLDESYRELKRLPGASGEEAEIISIQDKIRSRPDEHVSSPREKSETELELDERMKDISVPEESREQLEERLQSMKDAMLGLVDSYAQCTVKAEEQLESIQRHMEAEHKKVKSYKDMLDPSVAEEEEGMSVTTQHSSPRSSPVHAQVTSSSIPSDVEDKYLLLLEENRRQGEEIKRLEEENLYLIRKSRESSSDMDLLQRHMETTSTHHDEIRLDTQMEQRHMETTSTHHDEIRLDTQMEQLATRAVD